MECMDPIYIKTRYIFVVFKIDRRLGSHAIERHEAILIIERQRYIARYREHRWRKCRAYAYANRMIAPMRIGTIERHIGVGCIRRHRYDKKR